MAFNLTILGSNSSIPTASRFPTSQLVEFNSSYYLVDCGEGTQMQLRKYRIKIQRIRAIFITHMHGDHYFGLFGLLGTMHLLGRTSKLDLFAPPELQEMIDIQLKVAKTEFQFELNFRPLAFGAPEVIWEDDQVAVSTIPLQHRIPCNGFLFREHPHKRRIKKEALDAFKVPLHAIPKLKDGEDYVSENGEVIQNIVLTHSPHKSYSFAFCSDTKFDPTIVPLIQGVDVLYHEGTFLESEKERAHKTFHSTAAEAAEIAKMANAGLLIIGHYSARYHSIEAHLDQARRVYESTELAWDGRKFEFRENGKD